MEFIPLVLAFVISYVVSSRGFLFFDNGGAGVNEIVNTPCGRIKGQWNASRRAYSFLGVPYASPPVGKLRWKPPVPLKTSNGNCWTGELDATKVGNICLQPDRSNFSKATGDEDCLYLNVWTPSLNSTASLPVMVWVHGGNLVFGSGLDDAYAPSENLAAETNTVYVSMNYRLNAFGFMALETLRTQSATNTSGNYGLMDQIEVLRWVQQNIRLFGGDPNKVTIFGHSSGGTSVFALLGSPLTQDLFQKAWIASASPILNKTASQAFKDNEVFLKNTKCPDLDCLYNLSASNIISSIPWTEYPSWGMEDLGHLPIKGKFNGALAIVDGYVLPEAPLDAWVHGTGQDVPLLIGSTSHETDFGLNNDGENWMNWTLNLSYEKTVRNYLATFDDVISETALKLYPRSVKTPWFQCTSMSTDARVTCATDYISLVASTSFSSPVYRYVATYTPSEMSKRGSRYAFHGIDILAFFGTLDASFNKTVSRDLQFEQTVRREIMSFVKCGNPASSEWRPYPENTTRISDVIDVRSNYHSTECQFWLRNGFFSYGWIN